MTRTMWLNNKERCLTGNKKGNGRDLLCFPEICSPQILRSGDGPDPKPQMRKAPIKMWERVLSHPSLCFPNNGTKRPIGQVRARAMKACHASSPRVRELTYHIKHHCIICCSTLKKLATRPNPNCTYVKHENLGSFAPRRLGPASHRDLKCYKFARLGKATVVARSLLLPAQST